MLRTTASFLFLTAIAAAQVTCPGTPANMVPNGNFQDLIFNPWTVTSKGVITYPSASANGLTTSRCLRVAGNSFTAEQRSPITLSVGSTYLVTADLDVTHTRAVSCYVYLQPTAGGSRIRVAESYSVGKLSIVGRFTPSVTADYYVQVAGYDAYVDNVSIVPSNAPVMHVVDTRYTYAASGRFANRTNTMRVVGDPSANFALHFGGGGILPQPITLGFCGGQWLLAPPMLAASIGTLTSSNGTFVFSLPIPAVLQGVRLDWQAAHLAPTCELGCARAIAFF